jgi:formyltetrahydrofolate synthetase
MVIFASAFTSVPIHSKPLNEMDTQQLKIVNVYDLSDRDLNEIMQGKRSEIAVEFSAQTALPITFFLKGDLVNLIGKQDNFAQIEVRQTFYARYVQEELILSSDLAEWKPLSEFITEAASVALSIQEGQPSIIFGAKANRR